MSKSVIGIVVVLGLTGAAWAQPTIDVGDHYLLANTAGQEIQIYVSGGDEVDGLELKVQIGGGTSGPSFEDVDIFTGTIFADDHQGLFPGSYIETRWAYQGTVADVGPVIANGLLVTLTVNTAGVGDGEYLLSLTDTPEGGTDFAGIAAVIGNGKIIIPEPTFALLLVVGLPWVLRLRARRR